MGPIMLEGEIVMEPEAILKNHWVVKGSKFIEESLVKWCWLPTKEVTWEQTEELKDMFQKDALKEGGIDRYPNMLMWKIVSTRVKGGMCKSSRGLLKTWLYVGCWKKTFKENLVNSIGQSSYGHVETKRMFSIC